MIVDKRDYLWAFVASLLIIAWGTIPTWVGYRAETESLRFRGLYYDSQDYAVHLSMMQAGMQGQWTYELRFTSEPHHPAYIRLFYIILGHISAWFHLTPEFAFHPTRWILGVIALLTLFRLMQLIFRHPFWTRVAFLVAALGSGLGWLQLLTGWMPSKITPIDFWLIDDYVFFSLSVFPHFAFVTIGMCLALILWLRYLDTLRWTNIAWLALISMLVQVTNPIAFATIDLGIVGATLFSWWKHQHFRSADIGALILVALSQMPLLVYNIFVLNNDPIWSQFTAQNQTLSPSLDYYLWGFGLFWPFAILGTIDGMREKTSALGASIFWIISGLALAYAPVEIQRRFLQNITIPLAILSVWGFRSFFEHMSARYPAWMRWQSGLAFVFVFLVSLSSIQLILGRSVYLQTYPADFYYPRDLDDASAWLSQHAQPGDFILAAEQTSQVIAQQTDLRVYFGHEMETLAYKTKKNSVQSFYQGQMPKLLAPPIRWVIYGPAERELAADFKPPAALELVYDSNELKIYKVK